MVDQTTELSARDVLEVDPPSFTVEEAAEVSRRLFGLAGSAASLPSERDQLFLIDGGPARGVMKISNPGENPAILDMETLAALHVRRADPDLPLAMPWEVPGAESPAESNTAAGYRTVVESRDGTKHFVRMFDHLPGRSSVSSLEFDHDALWAFGVVVARLGRALRGFFHPAAGRVILWDVQHALLLRPLAAKIQDPRKRALVGRALDRFESHVLPKWPLLRAQVIHGDVTVDNTLVDDRHRVTGIVDLGDMSHTAMVCDVTSAWASMLWRRRGEDIFRAAAALLDGYESITPLEDLERSLLADLLAARAAAGASISALRVARYPDNEYIAGFADEAWPKLELYDELGPEEAARRFGGRSWTTAVPVPDLMQRRRARLGSALTEPTYDRPLHLVRGQGVWLIDAGGRRFLDAYNNVPVVGHCHPRVTEALVRQARALNTNMRYLHEAVIELAERLVESMPPDSGLDTVMMVNSGSEANDLAWRLATEVTGRTGGIVSEHAYHGVSWAIANLSPEAWPRGRRPSFVETFPPPDSYRADVVTSEGFERAVERLRSRDVSPAAVFVDGAFTSDGIFPPTPQHLSEIVDLTRQAGALYVADEVQVGHGRTGEHLWSFAASGIVPDIVTLGKPMGNGYPVAAMITRHELVDRFARETEFFSTFGGNPPAAVAALAVLDVIRDEGLVNHAQSIGAELRLGILQLADGHVSIGDVRGWGLLVGIDFVKSLGTREPDPASAENVANSLRERGVLVGITGRHDNVLKVRPPLIFGSEHVQLLLHELRDVLDASAVE